MRIPEVSSEIPNIAESTPFRDSAEELNFDVTADKSLHKKRETMNDPQMADLLDVEIELVVILFKLHW